MDGGDRDALVAELHRRRLGVIMYPSNAGCAGAKLGFSGTPRACDLPVVAAAPKRYGGPKPHTGRVFLCEQHQVLEAAAPLTPGDRRELQRRKDSAAYWDKVRAANRARAGQHHRFG